MSYLPVLIVGAGPTGLMMACELERHDIPFRIIDKKPEPTQGSNATWIQTRTLEIFNLIGVADQFLKIGHRCEAINIYVKGKVLANIPLTQIDSSYPFILMLPQRETERLLNKRLGESKIQVERSVELIDIRETSHGVVSTVRREDGDTETITSHWVVACDGANSTVREKIQIPFPGTDLPEQFMVADAQMSSFLPDNEIHVFFDKGTVFPDKGTIFSAFPWGSKEYRLSANLYMEKPRQNFYEHEVKEVVAERTYGNYIVESVSWISPFWIHGKITNQFQKGAIFLAGDAAHIHSPAGGQGMNMGIQDAFNLAWKLALVIKDKANKKILESYQLERHPVAKEVVNQADSLTNMALFDKSFVSELKKFSQKISKHPDESKTISEELTQLDIHYKMSPIINYQEKPDAKSPQQGERAPDVIINESESLYGYLHNVLHNILIFTGNKLTEEDILNIEKINNVIKSKFPDLVRLFVVTRENKHVIDNIIKDLAGAFHEHYNVKKSAVYIIRPDNYIGYYSDHIAPSAIIEFLQQYLLVK